MMLRQVAFCARTAALALILAALAAFLIADARAPDADAPLLERAADWASDLPPRLAALWAAGGPVSLALAAGALGVIHGATLFLAAERGEKRLGFATAARRLGRDASLALAALPLLAAAFGAPGLGAAFLAAAAARDGATLSALLVAASALVVALRFVGDSLALALAPPRALAR